MMFQAAIKSVLCPPKLSAQVWLVGGAILAVYVATLIHLPQGVFYSPDAGGKYMQMLGYHWDGGLQCDIVYHGAKMDPDGFFYGAQAGWEAHAAILPYRNEKGLHTGWPPWFSLLTQPLYRALGVPGLYVVPWAAGLMIVVLCGLLAERIRPGTGLPVAVVLALASPLRFYSLCYWEHTLAGALALAALLPMVRAKSESMAIVVRPYRWCIAGIFLLAASAVRRELIFFMGAGLLAWAWIHPRRWRYLPIVLGALAVVGAGGAYLLLVHPALLLWLVPSGGNNVYGLHQLINGGFWLEIGRHLVRLVLLFDFDTLLPWQMRWAALMGLAICLGSPFAAARWRSRMVLVGAVLVGVATVWLVCTHVHYRALNSLLLPAPMALLALLPSVGPSSDVRRWLGWTIVFFLGALCIVLPASVMNGAYNGLEWGSRYALVAMVLLNLLALVAVCETRSASNVSSSMRRAVTLVAAGLVLLGAASGVRGVHQLRQTRHELLELQGELERAGAPVVTDAWWPGVSLAPFAAHHEVYTLSAQHPFSEWLALVGRRQSRFIYVGERMPDSMAGGGGQWHCRQGPSVAGLSLAHFQRIPGP